MQKCRSTTHKVKVCEVYVMTKVQKTDNVQANYNAQNNKKVKKQEAGKKAVFNKAKKSANTFTDKSGKTYEILGVVKGSKRGHLVVKDIKTGKQAFASANHVILKESYVKACMIFDNEKTKKVTAKNNGKSYVVLKENVDRLGRKLVMNQAGQQFYMAKDNTVIKADYAQGTAYVENVKHKIRTTKNAKEKARLEKELDSRASYSDKNIIRIKGDNNKFWYIDKRTGRAVNLTQKEADAIIKDLDNAAGGFLGTGIGTKDSKLLRTNQSIVDPAVLNRIDKHYAQDKSFQKDVKNGKYKSHYEAFLGSEISNDEVYKFDADLVKQGAIVDQKRRNEILLTNLTTYGKKFDNRHSALDAVTTKEDYNYLQKGAARFNKANNVKAGKGETALESLIAFQTEDDANLIDLSFKKLFAPEKNELTTQAEKTGINLRTNVKLILSGVDENIDTALDSHDSEMYAQMDKLLPANKKLATLNKKSDLMMAGYGKFSNEDLANEAVRLLNEAKTLSSRYASSGENVNSVYALKGAIKSSSSDYQHKSDTNLAKAYGIIKNPEVLALVEKKCPWFKSVVVDKKFPKNYTTEDYLFYNRVTNNKIADFANIALESSKVDPKLKKEDIEANKEQIKELKAIFNSLRNEHSFDVNGENEKMKLISRMRSATLLGQTKEDTRDTYRVAQSVLQKLELAAEGKLVDKNGKHIPFEQAVKKYTGMNLAEVNQKYLQHQQYGEIAADLTIGMATAPLGGGLLKVAGTTIKGAKMLAEGTNLVSKVTRAVATGSAMGAGQYAIDGGGDSTFESRALRKEKAIMVAEFGGAGSLVGEISGGIASNMTSKAKALGVHTVGAGADVAIGGAIMEMNGQSYKDFLKDPLAMGMMAFAHVSSARSSMAKFSPANKAKTLMAMHKQGEAVKDLPTMNAEQRASFEKLNLPDAKTFLKESGIQYTEVKGGIEFTDANGAHRVQYDKTGAFQETKTQKLGISSKEVEDLVTYAEKGHANAEQVKAELGSKLTPEQTARLDKTIAKNQPAVQNQPAQQKSEVETIREELQNVKTLDELRATQKKITQLPKGAERQELFESTFEIRQRIEAQNRAENKVVYKNHADDVTFDPTDTNASVDAMLHRDEYVPENSTAPKATKPAKSETPVKLEEETPVAPAEGEIIVGGGEVVEPVVAEPTVEIPKPISERLGIKFNGRGSRMDNITSEKATKTSKPQKIEIDGETYTLEQQYTSGRFGRNKKVAVETIKDGDRIVEQRVFNENGQPELVVRNNENGSQTQIEYKDGVETQITTTTEAGDHFFGFDDAYKPNAEIGKCLQEGGISLTDGTQAYYDALGNEYNHATIENADGTTAQQWQIRDKKTGNFVEYKPAEHAITPHGVKAQSSFSVKATFNKVIDRLRPNKSAKQAETGTLAILDEETSAKHTDAKAEEIVKQLDIKPSQEGSTFEVSGDYLNEIVNGKEVKYYALTKDADGTLKASYSSEYKFDNEGNKVQTIYRDANGNVKNYLYGDYHIGVQTDADGNIISSKERVSHDNQTYTITKRSSNKIEEIEIGDDCYYITEQDGKTTFNKRHWDGNDWSKGEVIEKPEWFDTVANKASSREELLRTWKEKVPATENETPVVKPVEEEAQVINLNEDPVIKPEEAKQVENEAVAQKSKETPENVNPTEEKVAENSKKAPVSEENNAPANETPENVNPTKEEVAENTDNKVTDKSSNKPSQYADKATEETVNKLGIKPSQKGSTFEYKDGRLHEVVDGKEVRLYFLEKDASGNPTKVTSSYETTYNKNGEVIEQVTKEGDKVIKTDYNLKDKNIITDENGDVITSTENITHDNQQYSIKKDKSDKITRIEVGDDVYHIEEKDGITTFTNEHRGSDGKYSEPKPVDKPEWYDSVAGKASKQKDLLKQAQKEVKADGVGQKSSGSRLKKLTTMAVLGGLAYGGKLVYDSYKEKSEAVTPVAPVDPAEDAEQEEPVENPADDPVDDPVDNPADDPDTPDADNQSSEVADNDTNNNGSSSASDENHSSVDDSNNSSNTDNSAPADDTNRSREAESNDTDNNKVEDKKTEKKEKVTTPSEENGVKNDETQNGEHVVTIEENLEKLDKMTSDIHTAEDFNNFVERLKLERENENITDDEMAELIAKAKTNMEPETPVQEVNDETTTDTTSEEKVEDVVNNDKPVQTPTTKGKQEITPDVRMSLVQDIQNAKEVSDIREIQRKIRQYKRFPGRKNLRRAYKAKLREIRHQDKAEAKAQKYAEKFNERMDKIMSSDIYKNDQNQLNLKKTKGNSIFG